jgi:hypothetical protein
MRSSTIPPTTTPRATAAATVRKCSVIAHARVRRWSLMYGKPYAHDRTVSQVPSPVKSDSSSCVAIRLTVRYSDDAYSLGSRSRAAPCQTLDAAATGRAGRHPARLAQRHRERQDGRHRLRNARGLSGRAGSGREPTCCSRATQKAELVAPGFLHSAVRSRRQPHGLPSSEENATGWRQESGGPSRGAASCPALEPRSPRQSCLW